MDLAERARVFATAAHGAVGQKRKYTGCDFIVHPRAVANLVTSVGGTPEMIAAAWLHDVVEDTKITLTTIRNEFGPDVNVLVLAVTDISTKDDGNRAARKALDRDHIAQMSPDAKTIKLADLIDNTSSIRAHDPKFARVYLAEKRSLLEVLKDGDPTLWQRARNMIEWE